MKARTQPINQLESLLLSGALVAVTRAGPRLERGTSTASTARAIRARLRGGEPTRLQLESIPDLAVDVMPEGNSLRDQGVERHPRHITGLVIRTLVRF